MRVKLKEATGKQVQFSADFDPLEAIAQDRRVTHLELLGDPCDGLFFSLGTKSVDVLSFGESKVKFQLGFAEATMKTHRHRNQPFDFGEIKGGKKLFCDGNRHLLRDGQGKFNLVLSPLGKHLGQHLFDIECQ